NHPASEDPDRSPSSPTPGEDPTGEDLAEETPAPGADPETDPPPSPDEEGWIEVGSPKQRTMPPAWSDEAQSDAWGTTGPARTGDGAATADTAQDPSTASVAPDPWVQGPVVELEDDQQPARAADDPAVDGGDPIHEARTAEL